MYNNHKFFFFQCYLIPYFLIAAFFEELVSVALQLSCSPFSHPLFDEKFDESVFLKNTNVENGLFIMYLKFYLLLLSLYYVCTYLVFHILTCSIIFVFRFLWYLYHFVRFVKLFFDLI